MKFILSETTLNNLRTFLNRVDLKGGEVPAFVEIVNILNNPINEEENNKDIETE